MAHKNPQSIDSKVLKRISRKPAGWVFTPADFLDLGSRNGVDLALSRAARAGTIRKLGRGLYDSPRRDPKIGLLSPSIEQVARAMSGRERAALQVSGAHAANVLGLSTQVPVRTVFLTLGRSRKVNIGRQQIILKHTTPKQMTTAGRTSGTVIQALRWLGRRHVDDRVVATLRRTLSPADKQQLRRDLRHAPSWIADVLRTVVDASDPVASLSRPTLVASASKPTPAASAFLTTEALAKVVRRKTE
jgi:hypothetical protein